VVPRASSPWLELTVDDRKTVLTLRQLHPTVEQRDEKTGFGAVELVLQTMHKLARHLGSA